MAPTARSQPRGSPACLPLRDREVVKLPKLRGPMEEGADVPYFERRDSQLLLELTPQRLLDALPSFDMAAWKGNRARYHSPRRLPFLREHRPLLEDEDRYTLKGPLRHAIVLSLACCRTRL
jgi:hypothetical protein